MANLIIQMWVNISSCPSVGLSGGCCVHTRSGFARVFSIMHVWLKENGAFFFPSFSFFSFLFFFSFFSPTAADHWLFVAVFSLLSLRVCSVGSGPWEKEPPLNPQPSLALDILTTIIYIYMYIYSKHPIWEKKTNKFKVHFLIKIWIWKKKHRAD